MSASPRHDPCACPECRLTLPSRQALHRHRALDHRPASDGAWLTAQIVSASPTSDEPPRGGAGHSGAGRGDAGVSALLAERPAPTPGRRPGATPGAIRIPWIPVLALVALVALTVPAGIVTVMALLLLVRACTPRRQRPHRSDLPRHERRTPEA